MNINNDADFGIFDDYPKYGDEINENICNTFKLAQICKLHGQILKIHKKTIYLGFKKTYDDFTTTYFSPNLKKLLQNIINKREVCNL